jgi:stearoyl-CoA desaturase (Delta-9 desaturase)
MMDRMSVQQTAVAANPIPAFRPFVQPFSWKEVSWAECIPFLLVHIAVALVFFVPFEWKWVALCIGSYYLRMFAITAGYHRYFSHRSYRMKRVPRFLMALLGSTAVQKGVLWWAAHHRHHHKYSDQKEDIHSPIQRGFWWSHVGWFMSTYDETRWDQIQDLAKYPELRWLNRFHLIPVVAYAVLMFAIGGWSGLTWGFFVSTTLLWHGTFTINSLSHVFGSRRYSTTDDSRNNFWLALITLGEGWHNNHHAYMSSTRQGFLWWEFDPSYYTLKVLSWFRVVSDLRQPPLKALEPRLISRGSEPAHPFTSAAPGCRGEFVSGL